MKRHDIDVTVLNYIINKFNDGEFNIKNSYSYIYQDKNIKVEISKRSVFRLDEKVVIDFSKIENTENTEDTFKLYIGKQYSYKLSIDNSNKLRKVIEDIEDKLNIDFIRNNSEGILELLGK